MIRPLAGVLVTACSFVGVLGFLSRPLVLVNGRFLTMDADNSQVTSIGVVSGHIRGVGSRHEVYKALTLPEYAVPWYSQPFGIRELDLKGRTVVPGFVDAHSHFPASGLLNQGIDLSSPPMGDIVDIASLLNAITAQARRHSASRWIIGYSYDDSALVEQRHPTRVELDMAAPEHSVYLRHRSGHMGVANSRALRELGYEPVIAATPGTVVGEGKEIGRDSQQRMTGLLQDKATPGMKRLLAETPWWRLPGIFLEARDEYLRAGVTTVQNGFADEPTMRLLKFSSLLGVLPQRIVLWPAHDKLENRAFGSLLEFGKSRASTSGAQSLGDAIGWPETDRSTLKVGAIKLIADGSPQGRTAWLSEPYLPDEHLKLGYTGIEYIEESTLHELIMGYHRAGFQLAIHGNGDAAIQSIIDGLKKAQKLYPRNDIRHVIVHAQTITLPQLHALSAMNVSASFFPAHTFYWGDWYRKRALGEPRARLISPLASADEAGVRYTIHTDSPVTPISSMQLLWNATERRTSSGYLLGAEQRVSRLRALRAMTIDAAWQNHLDDDRGSLESGKLADFVILSDDPLSARDVRRIDVREVWIGGKRHFP